VSETGVLVRAQLQIEVLSPVHIGTGESLRSKSFAYLDERVYVADELKLSRIFTRSERKFTDFERFCLDQTSDQTLADFLAQQNVNVADIARYSLRLAGTRLGRDLLLFVKTLSIPPQPYIPGSSIKGAVRSALLRSTLLKHPRERKVAEKLVREKFSGGKPKQADDALEQHFFGTNPSRDWQHYDWMRLLQFSDTEPASLDNLEVAEVYTFSLKKSGLSAKAYVLSPEVLIPGTKLHSTLVVNCYLVSDTADERLKFRRFQQKIFDFTKACNVVAEEQIDQEIDFFKRCNKSDVVKWYEDLRKRMANLREDQCLLRIGWGAGYDAKTVSDVFDPDTFDAIRKTYELPVGRPGRKGPLLPKALSPKSRKLALYKDDADQKFVPLGWIQLTVH
jgi:CRISPR-associated protein Csm5